MLGRKNMVAVTRELARYAVDSRFEDLPEAVRHEGERAFVNILGCMLGGAKATGIDRLLAALQEFSGPPEATLIGRGQRADILLATLVNAHSQGVNAYNDTHLATVAHPTGPVAAPILALAERQPVTGTEFLNALILGIEIQLRVGNILVTPPARCPVGVSTQSILGVIGAAVASAKLLHLSEQQMVWAIGLATAQAAGHRETHATMSSHFVPANAARAGLVAALLAAQDYTTGEAAIEGPKGFAGIFASEPNFAAATKELGTSHEILTNTYKPYPCGIVVHPSIDGCLDLVREHDIAPDAIERVELTVDPLAIALCGIRPEPENRMQAGVSLHHWAAAAIVHRAAGLAQGTEECVHEPGVAAMRRRVSLTQDDGLASHAATVSLALRDGRMMTTHIEHCRGSRARPMSDVDLSDKFLAQAAIGYRADRSEALLAETWRIRETAAMGAFIRCWFDGF
jgi:2-methylcitrate dehydratase PrpD